MWLIDIWPPLPITIMNETDRPMPEYKIYRAIAHPNRVCEIDLRITYPQLLGLASSMQKQFLALIHLKLCLVDDGYLTPLPDGFLDGSAPRLQSLWLESIAFPVLPKLLLSTTDLVHLDIRRIPRRGYFSPESIVTCLAMLTNLESLTIVYTFSLSRDDREHAPPPTRTVLPALTHFKFEGGRGYLEKFVSRVDAPLLDTTYITFHHSPTSDIPQFVQFMWRTTMFQALDKAHVHFDVFGRVKILPSTWSLGERSGLRISWSQHSSRLDLQLSSVRQFFTSFFPSIYMAEHLYIYCIRDLPYNWHYMSENLEWLEIFHPFTSVKNLYVCKEFAQGIADALQELVRESTTVLPALESFFLEQPLSFESKPVEKAICNFIAARRLLAHPVTVSFWTQDMRSSTVLRRF